MQVQLWRHCASFAFMPNCRSVKEVKVVLLFPLVNNDSCSGLCGAHLEKQIIIL